MTAAPDDAFEAAVLQLWFEDRIALAFVAGQLFAGAAPADVIWAGEIGYRAAALWGEDPDRFLMCLDVLSNEE